MKIANISDMHLKTSNPINRIDNYKETQLNKFRYILKYCMNNKIDHLIAAGDIFDNPRQSLGYVGEIISLLHEYPAKFYAVAGQHDQWYRKQDLDNTPLGLLEAANVATILNDNPVEIDNVNFYGCAWESKIPEIKNKSKVNILSIHIMVIQNKLWNDQQEYTTGGALLKNNHFDLIVSGDNHQSFQEIYKGRKLVNCGSLTRSTVAQGDHKPSFYIYNTDTKELTREYIPIEPFEEVMLISEHLETKNINKKLEDYKLALGTSVDSSGLDFKFNLDVEMKNIENENIKNIIARSVNGN